jgi:hypothetical protein
VTSARDTVDARSSGVASNEGRLDVTTESSVVRAARFPDQTFLYRFQISVRVKNISKATVVIPAMVVEFFIGTTKLLEDSNLEKPSL